MNTGNNCPICEEHESVISSLPDSQGKLNYCKCKRCGEYSYSTRMLMQVGFQNVRHLISAWIRKQNDSGIRNPIVPPTNITDVDAINKWFGDLKNAGFPQTVTEKLDALLLAYAKIAADIINRVIDHSQFPELTSLIAARNQTAVSSLNELLCELQYTRYLNTQPPYGEIIITAKGWNRIGELSKSLPSSDSAFVAMWFHDCTVAYRESVTKALIACGYKPLIVDQTDFNGFIMDQVLSLIRQSRFIIADYTCLPEKIDREKVEQGVRGGVYWEAGFAYGMGKPVIHTCENNDECKNRLHFDVKQYNTIFWTPDKLTGEIDDLTKSIPNPNFAQELAQRILGTVGKGAWVELKEG